MSSKLVDRIRLGLGELGTVREQLEPLITLPPDHPATEIERAAACAMLHSFYTEFEKVLTQVARGLDDSMPSSDSWHRDLLRQMSAGTNKRPPVITDELAEVLSEFLAFRHLFRGASIILMRWEKLLPLIAKVPPTYEQTVGEVGSLLRFLEGKGE